MRVLFAALHFGYFRNLESVVEELAVRGHDVHLVAERQDSAGGGQSIVDGLAARHGNVTCGMVPGREADEWAFLAGKIRLGLDYLRYLEPAYTDTPALRARAAERAPRGITQLSRSPLLAARTTRRVLARALSAVDRAIPRSKAIERFLDEQRPDVLVITPLVGVVASSQLDLLRSAHGRRLPTAVCVWSWDHLSSKAIIRDLPARLFVWNGTQRDEAIRMHGVPADRIVVTGAQCFDRWFDRRPSRPRHEFSQHVGLESERPFLLWVCSALFPGSPSEAEFVVEWIRHVRASSDHNLRDIPILIRPHPSRTSEWAGVRWRQHGVAMWGGNPIDEAARADYFDSLFYSAAVVGLNTSAFIEAGVVGRQVLAILPPAFRANQEGTLHFRYLTSVGGGLLTTSRSLAEHERQLAGILGGAVSVRDRQRRFVEEFVRPHGLGSPATPVLADAIERLPHDAAAVAPPADTPALARIGLRAVAQLARGRGRAWILDERESRSEAQYTEKRQRTADALARKAAVKEEKARRRAERARVAR